MFINAIPRNNNNMFTNTILKFASPTEKRSFTQGRRQHANKKKECETNKWLNIWQTWKRLKFPSKTICRPCLFIKFGKESIPTWSQIWQQQLVSRSHSNKRLITPTGVHLQNLGTIKYLPKLTGKTTIYPKANMRCIVHTNQSHFTLGNAVKTIGYHWQGK